MKIEEARKVYNEQIKAYHERQKQLAAERQALEQKMRLTPEGSSAFEEEAAILELSENAVDAKLSEYKEYMNKLMEQHASIANMEVAKQQGEAMGEYTKDMMKIMEVARRIMKGGIVPPQDEKKLMEYDMEWYQAVKAIGAMAKRRKEYDSLWEEEEPKECADPMEVADNAEAFAEGPEVVPVEEVAEAASEGGES